MRCRRNKRVKKLKRKYVKEDGDVAPIFLNEMRIYIYYIFRIKNMLTNLPTPNPKENFFFTFAHHHNHEMNNLRHPSLRKLTG